MKYFAVVLSVTITMEAEDADEAERLADEYASFNDVLFDVQSVTEVEI